MTSPSTFTAMLAAKRRLFLLVATRLTRDADLAEDVVSAATLKALRKLDTFRDEASLHTWFHRIVVNAALEYLRSDGRRDVRTTSLYGEGGRYVVEPAVEARGCADLERDQARILVRRALRALPEQYRVPLELRYLEELEYGEVATRLGLSLTCVKSRILRGRRLLKLRLTN